MKFADIVTISGNLSKINLDKLVNILDSSDRYSTKPKYVKEKRDREALIKNASYCQRKDGCCWAYNPEKKIKKVGAVK